MDAAPAPAPADEDAVEEAIELLWAAAMPIVNAVFMCTIGAFLARRVRPTSRSSRPLPERIQPRLEHNTPVTTTGSNRVVF